MSIQEKLTKELINYIFCNLGIVPEPLWGKAGVTEDIFKTKKYIKIQFEEDNIEQYPIYAAECKIGEDILKLLTVCISDVYPEFVVVMQMNDLQVFGLKYNVEDQSGSFSISQKSGSWENPGMYDKLIFCAGIEKITDNGVTWTQSKDIDFLYKYLLEVVQN